MSALRLELPAIPLFHWQLVCDRGNVIDWRVNSSLDRADGGKLLKHP